jgi:5-methylthioribose kinase
VIDPEFSFYGPMAFDLAAVLANLLLAYFSRDWHGRIDGARPEKYQAWLLDQIRDVWSSFTEKFLTLWREHEGRSKTSFMGGDLDTGPATAFKTRFMQRLLSDTLGFAGCKMIRRIVGLAKVAEITRITDPIARAAIEVRCLFCAEKLLTERESLTSIEQVLQLAHELRSSNPE